MPQRLLPTFWCLDYGKPYDYRRWEMLGQCFLFPQNRYSLAGR